MVGEENGKWKAAVGRYIVDLSFQGDLEDNK
jgi:hypothetical protein